MSTSPNDPIPLANPMEASGDPAGGPVGVHREPDDHEVLYFEGPPSVRGALGKLVLAGVISLALLVICWWLVFSVGAHWWLFVITLMLDAALCAWPVLALRMRRYKITNYRIDFERGLISTTIDTIELWHVEDIVMHQSFWDKLLKVGSIIVKSHDATLPVLDMAGLPDPRRLFELLKQRIISVKRQRGVIKMDPG